MKLSNRNPVPNSWLAVEQADDGLWDVVRCWPDNPFRADPVRGGISTLEAAARYAKLHKSGFGHNAEID